MIVLVTSWTLAAVLVSAQSYAPDGRRDPFVNPSTPIAFQNDSSLVVCPPPAPAGYLIEETTLEGIVIDRKGPLALLRFVDGKSAAVREGAEFYDGRLTKIEQGGLEFEIDPRVGSCPSCWSKNEILSRTFRLGFPTP